MSQSIHRARWSWHLSIHSTSNSHQLNCLNSSSRSSLRCLQHINKTRKKIIINIIVFQTYKFIEASVQVYMNLIKWIICSPKLAKTWSRSNCVSLILFSSAVNLSSYWTFRVCRRFWLNSSSSISFCFIDISHVKSARFSFSFPVTEMNIEHILTANN